MVYWFKKNLWWYLYYGKRRVMSVLNPRFALRPMAKSLLDKKHLRGVEIGVNAGANSFAMLSCLDIDMLYLVDPYEFYFELGRYISYEKNMGLMQKRLRKFNDKVSFLKMKSVDAVDSVPGDLDFVYIDGDHHHPGVDNDIELYYKKVKFGGILGGHDFNNLFPDVIEAVLEFVRKKKLHLYVDGEDWWVYKGDRNGGCS